MQDKIQEIMGLVDAAIIAAEGHEATDVVRDAIESKLRELVREPLIDDQINDVLHTIPDDADDAEWMLTDAQLLNIIRAVERAHNITNTSGEV